MQNANAKNAKDRNMDKIQLKILTKNKDGDQRKDRLHCTIIINEQFGN